MKRFLLLLPLLVYCSASGLLAQVAKPVGDNLRSEAKETVASCQRAVQVLGEHMVKGKFLYPLEKMYPRYKRRQEILHGEKAYKNQFLNISKKMNESGITISSYKAERPVHFYRVWPQIKKDAKLKIKLGQQRALKAGDTFYNILAFVPTTQIWVFRNNDGRPPRKLKRKGFQIAIAAETEVPGQEQWTFIDGTFMTPQSLRSIFPSLAKQIVFPKREEIEVK